MNQILNPFDIINPFDYYNRFHKIILQIKNKDKLLEINKLLEKRLKEL